LNLPSSFVASIDLDQTLVFASGVFEARYPIFAGIDRGGTADFLSRADFDVMKEL
jgi:hypothetical protein